MFQLKHVAMLDTVEGGSKVKCRADRTDGAFVVTNIQALKRPDGVAQVAVTGEGAAS